MKLFSWGDEHGKLNCRDAAKHGDPAKHGDLRVWWVPQIPMKPFRVPVKTLAEAKLLIETLADYDTFQFENNVKGDYSNVGGLQVFDVNNTKDSKNGSWVDWYDDEGKDISDFDIDELRKLNIVWEGA